VKQILAFAKIKADGYKRAKQQGQNYGAPKGHCFAGFIKFGAE
jgi:hypothetical protein